MRFRSWSLPLVIAVITESALKEEYRIYTYGFHNPCVDSGKFNFFFFMRVFVFSIKETILKTSIILQRNSKEKQ